MSFANGYLASSGTNGGLEYQACGYGNDFGSLLALGIIYSDPHIIDWERKGNLGTPALCSTMTDGYEPSGWPWLTPDTIGNPIHDRSDLPLCRNFTGWGVVVCRTGWGESDTYSTFKYKGCEWWSHCYFDAGQFTIYNRGSLAMVPAPYHPGTGSEYLTFFGQQSIAHNAIRVFDAGDNPADLVYAYSATGYACQPPTNDGGQRRLGSGWQNTYTASNCNVKASHNYALDAPSNLASWYQHYWETHTGDLLAYATGAAYTYVAADLTAAYNIPRSRSYPGYVDRTMRLRKWVRQYLFIPSKNPGTALVVIFDQVQNAAAALPKAWVVHTINQPTINGNGKFTVQRTENVSGILGGGGFQGIWPNGWFGPNGDNLLTNVNSNPPCSVGGTAPHGTNSCYQYHGQLTGWAVFPASATLTPIGGPTHFGDDGSGGIGATGTNWDQALTGYGADGGGSWGLGDTNSGCTLDHMCPNNTTGPLEVGMWRLETYPPSQNNVSEQFGHVMYASQPGDSDIPTNATGAIAGSAPSRSYTMTINMALGCVWTLVFQENGLGSTISNNGNANCPATVN